MGGGENGEDMKRVTHQGKTFILIDRVVATRRNCVGCVFRHVQYANCEEVNTSSTHQLSEDCSTNDSIYIEDTPEAIAEWAAARLHKEQT
jgi:hypothetical protein